MKYLSSIIAVIIVFSLLGCKSRKNIVFQLVGQKRVEATSTDKGYLKEYYIIKTFGLDSLLNKKMDSTAMALGRTKGTFNDFYSVNYFLSSKTKRKEIKFFTGKDSLSLINKRKNIANYFFYKGFLRQKQTIVNGRILPPKYDSVVIKKNDMKIEIYND